MASKHTLKEWYLATRPWSFPASAMPVASTIAYLFWVSKTFVGTSPVDWLCGILALVGIILFHAGGNVISDYNDYRKGVDTPENAMMLPLVNGSFKDYEFRRYGIALLLAGCAVGVVLLLLTQSVELLYVGLAGGVLTVLYSFLKYRALGDVVIVLNYAILPIMGTSIVAVGHVDWSAMVLAVPLGLITDSILHINNARDAVSDRAAGARTFAMLIGPKASSLMYRAEVLLPFVWVVVAVCVGWLPVFTILVFVVAKTAWDMARQAKGLVSEGPAKVAMLDQQSAQLQAKFSVLMIVALVVSALAGWGAVI
ncbi:MAG: prenyltransferase [Tidjanibacter sp.]|nr:prenyltransferase [Tidjanibacter sp.]MBQ5932002.1 prenyltransferase [Tidjanibacter sp.]